MCLRFAANGRIIRSDGGMPVCVPAGSPAPPETALTDVRDDPIWTHLMHPGVGSALTRQAGDAAITIIIDESRIGTVYLRCRAVTMWVPPHHLIAALTKSPPVLVAPTVQVRLHVNQLLAAAAAENDRPDLDVLRDAFRRSEMFPEIADQDRPPDTRSFQLSVEAIRLEVEADGDFADLLAVYKRIWPIDEAMGKADIPEELLDPAVLRIADHHALACATAMRSGTSLHWIRSRPVPAADLAAADLPVLFPNQRVHALDGVPAGQVALMLNMALSVMPGDQFGMGLAESFIGQHVARVHPRGATTWLIVSPEWDLALRLAMWMLPAAENSAHSTRTTTLQPLRQVTVNGAFVCASAVSIVCEAAEADGPANLSDARCWTLMLALWWLAHTAGTLDHWQFPRFTCGAVRRWVAAVAPHRLLRRCFDVAANPVGVARVACVQTGADADGMSNGAPLSRLWAALLHTMPGAGPGVAHAPTCQAAVDTGNVDLGDAVVARDGLVVTEWWQMDKKQGRKAVGTPAWCREQVRRGRVADGGREGNVSRWAVRGEAPLLVEEPTMPATARLLDLAAADTTDLALAHRLLWSVGPLGVDFVNPNMTFGLAGATGRQWHVVPRCVDSRQLAASDGLAVAAALTCHWQAVFAQAAAVLQRQAVANVPLITDAAARQRMLAMLEERGGVCTVLDDSRVGSPPIGFLMTAPTGSRDGEDDAEMQAVLGAWLLDEVGVPRALAATEDDLLEAMAVCEEATMVLAPLGELFCVNAALDAASLLSRLQADAGVAGVATTVFAMGSLPDLFLMRDGDGWT